MHKRVCAFVGDFYHKYEIAIPAVEKAIELLGNAVVLEDCKAENIPQILSTNPDAIIMVREDRLNPEDAVVNHWLTPEMDEKITDYVKNGGNFIAMHTAIASYPENSKYVDMLKGYFISHPPEHYKVRYTSNEKLPFGDKTGHTKPYDFEVMDEHYVTFVDEANTNVFMSHASAYGKHAAGWCHAYGKGKVMVLVPTHNKEGFEHPETIRLIHEAIVWALS